MLLSLCFLVPLFIFLDLNRHKLFNFGKAFELKKFFCFFLVLVCVNLLRSDCVNKKSRLLFEVNSARIQRYLKLFTKSYKLHVVTALLFSQLFRSVKCFLVSQNHYFLNFSLDKLI